MRKHAPVNHAQLVCLIISCSTCTKLNVHVKSMPFLLQPLGVDFGGGVTPIHYDTIFYLAGFGDGAGHSTARVANSATYCYIHDTTDAGYSNYGPLDWASNGSVSFTAVASDTMPTPMDAVTAVSSGDSALDGFVGQYLAVGWQASPEPIGQCLSYLACRIRHLDPIRVTIHRILVGTQTFRH
jgi:hypothetical protein